MFCCVGLLFLLQLWCYSYVTSYCHVQFTSISCFNLIRCLLFVLWLPCLCFSWELVSKAKAMLYLTWVTLHMWQLHFCEHFCWCRYLLREVLNREDRDRTHVFSSFFYRRLMQKQAGKHSDEANMTSVPNIYFC